MAKILSKTELRVLEGRTHRIICDHSDKIVQPKHKAEYEVMLDDLNVRLTNYQILLNNPERHPKYKGDPFETEMEILRSHASRLDYLTKPTVTNSIFNTEDPEDSALTEYSLKNELISLVVLFIAAGGLAWCFAS